MSFTLDIRFSGMCGFVPVEIATERAVHVLFPDTTREDAFGPDHHAGSAHGAAEHVHVSRLLFHTSALGPGAPQDGRKFHVVASLKKRLLVIGNGGVEHPGVTNDLAELQFLKPGFLGAAANAFITTRVILRAGRETCAESGAYWLESSGAARPLSHQLVWRINDLTEPLRLTLRSLEGKADLDLPPLYPDALGNLSLHILHVPRAELPPEPQEVASPRPGTPAPHFSPFKLLVTEPVVTPPIFIRDPDGIKCPGGERGLSPYTCLGARIAFDPEAVP